MKKQELLNKEIIAADATGTMFLEGKPVGCKLDKSTLIYLGREKETLIDPMTEEEATQTRAFVIEVENPVTRAKAINAAEMKAYGLKDALEVASFNASLARKARIDEDAEEVADHDELIAWVKAELTKAGL